MSTTTETKKTTKMEQVFALWKNKSKSGMEYFTGTDGKMKLVAFYNGKKKNPKEPDLRVYPVDADGNAEKEELVSMWCNVSKNGKKYLTGKLAGQRIIGFINENPKNDKQPYVSVYISDDAVLDQASKITKDKPKAEPQEEKKPF